MTRKRVISRSKTYGFNPWVDQIDAINQIMADTGEKTESVLLRSLVDEALAARLTKNQSPHRVEAPENEYLGPLGRIENLLTQLGRQGDVSIHIEDLCLALIQDTLAEAHATRRLIWEALVTPKLREEGVDAEELKRRFLSQANQAKSYAYSLAEQIEKT